MLNVRNMTGPYRTGILHTGCARVEILSAVLQKAAEIFLPLARSSSLPTLGNCRKGSSSRSTFGFPRKKVYDIYV